MTPADPAPLAPPLTPPRRPLDLFLGYARAGAVAFGGANVHIRRMVVEERRWLSERDHAEILGLGQVLPGPNVGNAAIFIGRRFHGWRGAVAATAGLYAGPLVVLVALLLLWRGFAGNPTVSALLHGLACAAAGLVIGNALRMTRRLRPPPELIAVGLLAAAGAWWGVPLPFIVLGLGPVGVAAAWRRMRGHGR